MMQISYRLKVGYVKWGLKNNMFTNYYPPELPKRKLESSNPSCPSLLLGMWTWTPNGTVFVKREGMVTLKLDMESMKQV